VNSFLDSVSYIAVGAYLVDIVIMGNVQELFALLKQEGGYLNWLFALFAIGVINGYLPPKLAGMMTTAMFIIGAYYANLYLKKRGTSLSQVTTDFANGKTSLFGAVKNIVGSFS
jgi:hypothetical protein